MQETNVLHAVNHLIAQEDAKVKLERLVTVFKGEKKKIKSFMNIFNMPKEFAERKLNEFLKEDGWEERHNTIKKYHFFQIFDCVVKMQETTGEIISGDRLEGLMFILRLGGKKNDKELVTQFVDLLSSQGMMSDKYVQQAISAISTQNQDNARTEVIRLATEFAKGLKVQKSAKKQQQGERKAVNAPKRKVSTKKRKELQVKSDSEVSRSVSYNSATRYVCLSLPRLVSNPDDSNSMSDNHETSNSCEPTSSEPLSKRTKRTSFETGGGRTQ